VSVRIGGTAVEADPERRVTARTPTKIVERGARAPRRPGFTVLNFWVGGRARASILKNVSPRRW
jgi:hypothetical protein